MIRVHDQTRNVFAVVEPVHMTVRELAALLKNHPKLLQAVLMDDFEKRKIGVLVQRIDRKWLGPSGYLKITLRHKGRFVVPGEQKVWVYPVPDVTPEFSTLL